LSADAPLIRASRRDERRVTGAALPARTALLILLAALFVRFAYLALVYHGGDSLRSLDSPIYEEYAQNLLEGCGGAACDPAYLAARVPGYPLFLAAIRTVAGPNPFWPVVAQMLIDAGTCLLVAWLAALFDRRLALSAGLLAAANLNMIASAGQVLTDTLFLFPFTASLVATVLYLEAPSTPRAFAAGLLLGLALFVRSTVMFFPPLMLAALAIAAWRHRLPPARAVAHLAVAAIGALLCVAPVLARNVATHGRFALVSQGGIHAIGWVVPAAREFVLGIPFEEGQRQMRAELSAQLAADHLPRLPDDPFAASDEMEKAASKALKQLGVMGLAKAWLGGAMINLGAPALVSVPPVAALERPHFYATPGTGAVDKVWAFGRRAAGSLFFWLMVPALMWMAVSRALELGALGVIGRGGGLPLGPSLYLLAVALYFVAVTGPVTGVKYRLPLEPMLVLLLAESGARLCAWRASRALRVRRRDDMNFISRPDRP
jgi:4-amino-4-deoxy-L-arabinose transferase-like glycosyltransferase